MLNKRGLYLNEYDTTRLVINVCHNLNARGYGIDAQNTAEKEDTSLTSKKLVFSVYTSKTDRPADSVVDNNMLSSKSNGD